MQLAFKKYFNNKSFYSGDTVRSDIHVFHVSVFIGEVDRERYK